MSLRRQPSAAGAGATPLPPTRAPLPQPLSASAQFRRIAAVLLLVLGIHGAGLFLFKEGYLLTRLELNSTATCPTVPPWSADFVPPAAAASAGGATSKACWPHARFDRTLLIMIDALRFDFIAYNESIPPTATPYYINKVPVISRMLKTRPAHSLLYRGLADPPTTTLQRLIALMTGALPTLVDAGSNFGSSAIREDNLVGHLQRAGRRVVSMGDDTWDRLFPTSLNETYPYPSFDVWDLHSVDEGVISHLFPALEKRRRSAAAAAAGAAGTRTSTGNDSDSDWGLLIAHFLGVDHAGHRYGPGHPAMGDKLIQMDGVLQRVFDAVDDGTLVIVMGDHGMDTKGDHGGDSDAELDAGLFLYSSSTPLTDVSAAGQRSMAAVLDGLTAMDKQLAGASHPFSQWEGTRTVPQIDLVATVALLMGLPIPYGSLGTAIPELFLVGEKRWWGSGVSGIEHLVAVARINAVQLHTYIAEYSQRRREAAAAFADASPVFARAEQAFERLAFAGSASGSRSGSRSGTESGHQAFVDTYLLYARYMRETLLIARKIWSRFETSLMYMGDTVLVLGVVATGGLAAASWYSDMIVPSWRLLAAGFGCAGVAGIGGFIGTTLYPGEDKATLMISPRHEVLFFGILGLLAALAVSVATQWQRRVSTTPPMSSPGAPSCIRYHGALGAALWAMYVGCIGSDSFTIFEDHVLTHFVQLFAAVTAFRALFVPDARLRSQILTRMGGFFVLARCLHASTICRGDQGYCSPTFNGSSQSSVAALHTPVLLGVVSLCVVWALRTALRREGMDAGVGRFASRWIVPVALFLAWVYWLIDTVEAHELDWVAPARDLETFKFYVARCMWCTIPVAVGALVRSPACVADAPKHSGKKQDGTGSATADADARESVFVDRARTASGTYLVILAFVYVTMSLFQKPMGGVAMGLAFLQVLCLIDNVALWRLAALSEVQRRNKKQEDGQDGQDGQDGHGKHDNGNADCNAAADGAAGLDLTGVYFEHLVLLLLCGQRAFFSTGHQNALPSIQYEVGFIGLDGVNWILSPMFIGINTYGGPILFALAVPLVPLWGAWPQSRSARTASSVSVSVTAGESGPSGPSGPEARRLAARIAREVGQAMLVYHGLISGAEVTGVTVFVGWFRRHSQAWRVWGPKYIFYFVGHSGIFALGIVMLGVVHQCLA